MAKRITVSLTRREALAVAMAVADCACEGLRKYQIALHASETWGDDWREDRKAAMAAAGRLVRKAEAR